MQLSGYACTWTLSTNTVSFELSSSIRGYSSPSNPVAAGTTEVYWFMGCHFILQAGGKRGKERREKREREERRGEERKRQRERERES